MGTDERVGGGDRMGQMKGWVVGTKSRRDKALRCGKEQAGGPGQSPLG